jgi:hypothetical protein
MNYYNLGIEKYNYVKENNLDLEARHFIQQMFDRDPNISQENIDMFLKGWTDTCEECKK